MPNISLDKKRNTIYQDFLNTSPITLNRIIKLGNRLMRKAKLHRHFFFKPTFWERLYGTTYMLPTAQYLAFYALSLPYEYHNKQYTEKILSKDEAVAVLRVFERRIHERCPVEYITQECWYLDHQFYVNEHVLVPRSVMNTRFKDFLKETTWENYRVLDLCTGSGCIGITLALLDPRIKVDLADISIEALKVAKINIARYQLENRVYCIQSDLFSNIENKYDLIITNPPYVSSKMVNAGPAEIKCEPRIALEGGPDGLDLVRKIIEQAKMYLNPQGRLIAEVGFAAPKLLKKRYPMLQWLGPKPAENESTIFDFFLYSGECVFVCDAEEL